MVVVFATLGWTPGPVVAPLRGNTDISEFHVFFGPPGHPDGKKALREVRTVCKTLGVPLHEHPVKDAFDYTAFLKAFTDARQTTTDDILFNASGGTRIMVMAATIFCFSHDVPLHYHNEEDPRRNQVVPIRAWRTLPTLGNQPRAILGILQTRGRSDMTSLGKELGLARSTVTEHVRLLARHGTVHVEQQGKHRFVSITPALEDMDLTHVTERGA